MNNLQQCKVGKQMLEFGLEFGLHFGLIIALVLCSACPGKKA